MFGNLFIGECRVDAFDIDADFAGAGDRVEGQMIGMGKIEVHAIDGGFAVGIVNELDGSGVDRQILCEKLAQHSAGGDEASAMNFEMKTVGAPAFIRVEKLAQMVQAIVGEFEIVAIQVDAGH